MSDISESRKKKKKFNRVNLETGHPMAQLVEALRNWKNIADKQHINPVTLK